MKVTTHLVNDYTYRSVNETGNEVMIDMLPPEAKQHQSPTQLVLSAVGACAAVDIVQMLRKKRKTVNDLVIESEGTRREEHPRAFTSIDITFTLHSPDTDLDTFEKVVTLAVEKYCSVASSLTGNVNIQHFAKIIAS